LAEEAKIDTNPKPTIETPNTFDLDAMLDTPTSTSNKQIQYVSDKKNKEELLFQNTTPSTREQKQEIQQTTPNITTEQITTENNLPKSSDTHSQTSSVLPAFTIPPTTTIEGSPPIHTQPHSVAKNTGVKTLLFVVLFVALGFTTYFILQTMYPVEFANMFNKNTIEQIHFSDEIDEDILDEDIINEENEHEDNIEAGEDAHESAPNFGELNDLFPQEDTHEETNVLSRLTDYVNEGKKYRDIGETLNNTTLRKYGQYVHKKALEFMEKIAKGEEIDTLQSNFAQFDTFIKQMEQELEENIQSSSSSSMIPNDYETSPEQEPEIMTNQF